MKICAIDIHHHYVPNSLLAEAKSHGKALGVEFTDADGQKALSFAGSPKFVLQRELSAVDERLKMMQESKLAVAALEAHTATLGYRLTGEQGESWCRVYNEGIKELVTRHPDRFVGIASVPLQDATRAAKVLEHAVRDLKLCGGYIGTNVNGNYYGTEEFDPFWAKAQELDVMVVMHPEDVAGADKMNPYGLKLICGNPADSALCSSRRSWRKCLPTRSRPGSPARPAWPAAGALASIPPATTTTTTRAPCATTMMGTATSGRSACIGATRVSRIRPS